MDLFFEEPTPLRFCPAVSNKRAAGSLPSACVLYTVKKSRHIVGLSCESFEEELMALFVAIEVGHLEQASPHVPVLEKKQQKIKASLLHEL